MNTHNFDNTEKTPETLISWTVQTDTYFICTVPSYKGIKNYPSFDNGNFAKGQTLKDCLLVS